jgi:collagenase-like PrtC family protease
VLTYWTRASLVEFYGQVAESTVDTVVLGEVICSRRNEMKTDDWLALGRDLAATGKEVVLATMALVESESDLRTLRRLAEQGEFLVEAGDMSAVRILAQLGRPFVIGPHVNVYSHDALAVYAAMGGCRWIAPVELPLCDIACIGSPVRGAPGRDRLATEVWAFGRLPLAFSARCFTARHHRLRKDDCQFRCMDDSDGLLLSTSDGQPFLTLNGIQTQSAGQHCLIGEGEALRSAGVSRLRLSPQSRQFGAVIECFERVMNRGGDAGAAREQLAALSLPGGLVNGFAHGRPGVEQVCA